MREGASGGDIFKPEKQGASWPDGYGRLVCESIDSTLSEAARRAPELTGPLWILAEEQTAARGRRGRSWATPKGNFAGTLMMRRVEAPGIAALRSFVASLALRRAFVRVTGDEGAFALKWPNDVLLNGGKVAGILLETIGDHLAIGIGVNLAPLRFWMRWLANMPCLKPSFRPLALRRSAPPGWPMRPVWAK